MPISNKKEEIDIRILRLVGLDDVFDLDYETYLTLLKEAMVRGRMGNKSIPTEEMMLLTDEYKRVKTKKDQGRFEVRKRRISASSFNNITPIKGLIAGSNSKKISLSSIRKSSSSSGIDDNISKITSSLVSISESLKQQKKLKESEDSYNKRKSEQDKRELAENKLEKRFEGLKKIAENIIAPVKTVLDKILEFFTTIILGRIVYKIIEWMGNKENTSKLKSIIRFIKDWWPALLGSYVLFGTTFGKFIRGTVGLLARFIFQIGKVAIPQLLKFIKSPFGKAAVLFTAGATVPAMFPGTVNAQERKTKSQPGSSEEKIRALEKQKADLNFFQKIQGVGSEIDEQIYSLKTGRTKAYFGGGYASGFVSGEKGVDKIPAMLSDGEFVMSRGAVQQYGVDTLEAMNAAGGGTNRPKIISGTTYAAGGGLMGKFDGHRMTDGVQYYVDEIIKGLAPQYSWASDLARKSGISIKNYVSNAYNSAMNQGVNAQKYVSNGGLERDFSKLMNIGSKFGTGVYNQALQIGNKSLIDIKSGELQKTVSNSITNISKLPKQTGVGFFDYMKKMTSSKKYMEDAKRMNKTQDKMINFSDRFINYIPEGPFKEMFDKGFIPIPSGNATAMRNLTFVKALLGPLGRPFKILSNREVNEMRQKTIDKTMEKHGLIIDPKTGEVKMNWNQEDINKRNRGGGAFSNDLGLRGSQFNSILGRFSASTEGNGNVLYTNDRYNFNKTAAEYAELAKQGLLKGSMGDALYFGASMLGRFSQDIGWLNQRALGSNIRVGEVNKNMIDSLTGKKKTPQQLAEDRKSQIRNKYGQGVTLYNKPQKNTGQPYKSRFARPRNAGVRPVPPPASRKPKVVYGPPVPKRVNVRGGKTATVRTPSFNASSNSRQKINILGIRI